MSSALVRKVRKTGKEKPFLPDEIITNILIRLRLPVKNLIRFVLVCKGWRDIILSRHFVDFHLKTRIPVILISSVDKLFALDKWWEFDRNRLMPVRFPSNPVDFRGGYHIWFSIAGLIVISGIRKNIILNPARPSNESVQISVSQGISLPLICAVYYHPIVQEYVALLKMVISDSNPREQRLVQYKLLTLGSSPSLKMITSSLRYEMKQSVDPVYIHGYVYWMVRYENDGHKHILKFDIIREEFVVIPCPDPWNTDCKDDQTQLLNSVGVLVCVLVLPSTITIWSLADHGENLWTSIEYTVSLHIPRRRYRRLFKIISLADGMLAYMYDRILFVCNLKEGTVKNNPKKRYAYASFFSHQMSLASLKNCKSEICIDKDGELLL